ncbi:MAG: hypothetical protein HUU38_23005 [Anaerolineales bacterium]|nr:hypothetical protein [Anaerolineales bacterium]
MPPLPHAHYQPLPLRTIRPGGWLHDFLQCQATGLSPETEEIALIPYGATMLRISVFPQG